eukprot:TRINITY_DN12231_c0_g1_i5.p2 TRINITY_DN12231_c0_g1~~TRINITY_DN12231_c0_g1_i5.p2  ORF type:complete len:111 (-),score=11.26 TRINITY_DN12231_c0_g1_i5:10-342(-)
MTVGAARRRRGACIEYEKQFVMQADTLPRFDNLAQVERIDSSSPSLVFGFQAYGEEGDLQRLGKALKAARIEFQRFDYHTRSVVVSPPYSEIGRAVQQECRDRSRMPSSA